MTFSEAAVLLLGTVLGGVTYRAQKAIEDAPLRSWGEPEMRFEFDEEGLARVAKELPKGETW